MQKRTVFVVGAGASTDFGLPLGSGLVRKIRDELTSNLANPLHSDTVFNRAMDSGLHGDYGAAAREVAGGMVSARSIDRFLDSRSDRPLTVHMGKCAIAHVLLTAEMISPFGRSMDEEWQSIQQTLINCDDSWLATTFSLLHEGIRPAASEKIFENISFITFNYDRCIERYIYLALKQIMGKSGEEANFLLSEIPIIHIYGSLGALPTTTRRGVPFGASINWMLESANLLKTFTEGTADGVIDSAHELIVSAEQIIFLGFAFDPLNVLALFPEKLTNNPIIYATCGGVANPEKANFQNAIGEININWVNSFCQDFCRTLEYRTLCKG